MYQSRMEGNMVISRRLATALAALLYAVVSGTTVAAEATRAKQDGAGSEAVKQPASGLFINYRPPLRGAPSRRVGGGSRGDGDAAADLYVLAPDHTGLTTSEQPVLYWYISKPVDDELVFTLVDDMGVEPLVETTISSPKDAGIYPIKLADYAVQLKIDTEYQWFITIVRDPAQRSMDRLAGGVVKQVAPADGITRRLQKAGRQQAAAIYAESGLWYDAVDVLSREILANPGDTRLREQRAQLLEGGGMEAIAAFDRGLAVSGE